MYQRLKLKCRVKDCPILLTCNSRQRYINWILTFSYWVTSVCFLSWHYLRSKEGEKDGLGASFLVLILHLLDLLSNWRIKQADGAALPLPGLIGDSVGVLTQFYWLLVSWWHFGEQWGFRAPSQSKVSFQCLKFHPQLVLVLVLTMYKLVWKCCVFAQ